MLFFIRTLLIIYVLIPCYFSFWTVLKLLSAPPSWEPKRRDWEAVAGCYILIGPMILSCMITLVQGLHPVLVIADLLGLGVLLLLRLGGGWLGVGECGGGGREW